MAGENGLHFQKTFVFLERNSASVDTLKYSPASLLECVLYLRRLCSLVLYSRGALLNACGLLVRRRLFEFVAAPVNFSLTTCTFTVVPNTVHITTTIRLLMIW